MCFVGARGGGGIFFRWVWGRWGMLIIFGKFKSGGGNKGEIYNVM